MRQHVALADDLPSRNLRMCRLEVLGDPPRCLANCLDATLDGKLHHSIAEICVPVDALSELLDGPRRVQHVPEIACIPLVRLTAGSACRHESLDLGPDCEP